MARFIWKFLYIIGTIPHLLIPVIASPQFDKDFTLPALGDSPTPQVATPPNPAPDALPDDFQWTTSQAQNPNLLAQPQSLDDLNDGTFDPSLIALSPADTQTADPKSSPVSGSCAAKANLKPGASRLLRRAYGERQPCCDPVNLGLDNPMNWLFGQDHIETRSPYCCEGGAIEYARRRLCVPWEQSHAWCKDPDNWSCCIYGGPIFNGQVFATHCWSIYPAPVKEPEPAQHQR